MLYDIDSFGFVCGYISKNWSVMSERDLLADKHLAVRLKEAKYQSWKRHNILELKEEYDMMFKAGHAFDTFCREVYRKKMP